MSSEASDGDPPDEEPEPVASFFAGLRDATTPPARHHDDDPPVPPARGRGLTRPDLGAEDGRPRGGSRKPPRLDETCPVTAALRAAETLEDLRTVGPAVERRYGTERRVTTAAGFVDVRACRVPDGDTSGYTATLRNQFERWATVSDIDGVVSVIEFGTADQPWLATAAAGSSIGGHDPDSAAAALQQAVDLADTLAALHGRGIVHAGIEPGTVVFTPGTADRGRPAFHNVGLVDVYRRFEDPSAVFDPRYAAPEYFGSDRGIVDRATDIYGLGAVCFRLLTGVAPVAGTAAAIADRVTADDPIPAPSRVEPGLPESVDDVIQTATATNKFDRYETATEFRDALEAAREDVSG